jgi:WXXGXW repeat (2 copies)
MNSLLIERNSRFWLSLGFAALAFGISSAPLSAQSHHPVYVAAISAEIVINEAPPPLREEKIIVARPSPAHVWVKGYWRWHDGRHVWVPGRWELPPHHGMVWVEPRWEHRGHGYVFVEGGWHEGPAVVEQPVIVAPPAGVNIVVEEPPPPRHEVMVARPSPDHVWIGGYWRWHDGHHVWVEGHWQRPPHPGAVWVEPRWEHREHGYVFVEGFWH